eukprot:766393-Hanusia_phi.AAC.20
MSAARLVAFIMLSTAMMEEGTSFLLPNAPLPCFQQPCLLTCPHTVAQRRVTRVFVRSFPSHKVTESDGDADPEARSKRLNAIVKRLNNTQELLRVFVEEEMNCDRLAWSASRSSLPPAVKMNVMEQVSTRLQSTQGELLSPLDISNIAWSFGNVGYQGIDGMRILSNLSLAWGLNNFSAQSLSNLLWACAKLQYKDIRLTSCIREEVVTRSLRGFNSQEISNLVWAFVIIEGGLDGHLLFRSHNINVDLQSISNIVWALAKCDVIDDEVLQAVSCHVATRGLSNFKIKDVCLLIHGYSNSEVGSDLFSALAPWLQQTGLQQLTEDQIASFAWVLANRLRLRQVPNRGNRQRVPSWQFSYSSIDPMDDNLSQHGEDLAELQLMRLIRAWILSRPLSSYSPKDLSLLVWSFAVSFPMEKLILSPVHEYLCSQALGNFPTLSLVNIAWAYAHILKRRDEFFVPGMKRISNEIYRRGAKNIPSHQLASFAWSCCKLGLRDEPIFEEIASSLDAAMLQRLTQHSMISLLWALGMTDSLKNRNLVDFEEEILRRQVRTFNAIELNAAALAFSRSRYQGKIWEALEIEAIRRSQGKEA